MTNPYRYSPLADQHIRLLTLLPGESESEIFINLASIELDVNRPPDYEALSYAWGTSEKAKTVNIISDDVQYAVLVTDNLYSALEHLRLATQIRTLWIDALCINQQDIEERNSQVARMADIYKSTNSVLIWLGPAADRSSMAIETLESLASRITVDRPTSIISHANSSDTDIDLLNMEKPLPFQSDIWISLESFLGRAWFSRLWIWQEVFLARNGAILVCGFDSMSWDHFCKAIFLLDQKPKFKPNVSRLIGRSSFIGSLNFEEPLLDVLEKTKEANCTDPRDRIYGVLHLIEEPERLVIQPNYSNSTIEVFRDLIVSKAINYGDLSLLSSCELGDKPLTMPSWVPNWSNPRKSNPIWNPAACWNAATQVQYTDDRLLVVSGCYVATISQRVSILESDDSKPATADVLYNALRRLVKRAQDYFPNNFDQRLELLCRTLCCNGFADSYEPICSNYPDFQETVERLNEFIDFGTEILLKFLIMFYANTLGRAFIFTDEGEIGLAPEKCQSQDIIAVILGCQSPIVLRPTVNEQYTVVGECYMHRVTSGEVFLGKLSTNWKRVWRIGPESPGHHYAFIDRERGIWQNEDPRLDPLPDDWVKVERPAQHLRDKFRRVSDGYESFHDPRMLPEALRDRGFSIQDFSLV